MGAALLRGDRLGAEVLLLTSGFLGQIRDSELAAGCAQIHRSYGFNTAITPLSTFAVYQANQPEPKSSVEAWHQYLPVADLPDALLFWVLHRRLPALTSGDSVTRIRLLQRLAILLLRYFPCRPDLPYQVLMCEPTGVLLKSAPTKLLARSVVFTARILHHLAVSFRDVTNLWLSWHMAQLHDGFFI